MRKTRILFIAFTSLSLLGLSGCYWNRGVDKQMNEQKESQNTSKKEEIAKNVAKSFESTLEYYPTPNIETLLDKDMGSQLILGTDVNTQKDKDDPLISKGMVLYLNTSTKKGYGYYYISYYYDDVKKNKEKKYPVEYNHGIHLRKSTGDKELDEEINNFKFLFQYANFKDLTKHKVVDTYYNPEVPLFSADYELSNEDSLVKKLRHDCHFTQKEAPIVHLQGTGNYGGSPSFGSSDYRQIEITFSKNPDNFVGADITYNDNWTEEEDNQWLNIE